jgi:phage baseplate assembly protein W
VALTLTLPLVVTANGRLGTIVQGSPEELAQSIGLLLSTRPGERKAVPGYGLTDPLGVGLKPTEVDRGVASWEPRAVDVDVEVLGLMIQAATVRATAVPPTVPWARTEVLT